MARSETLAALGGKKIIPDGMIKPWPPVTEDDKKKIASALDSGAHTVGPNYAALEQEFAAWNGNKHAVFCNSGTAALHMAIVAAGCRPGDQVITPAYTWPSSATCCLHHNVTPVFVDIDFDTMNIDPKKIEAAVNKHTRAIIAVHLHGLPADMDPIMAVARKHNLVVIEDCCQAHGATYKGRKVGTIGDLAAFSCNQNKILCAGEGGFLVTDNDDLFNQGRTLWYFGESRPPEGTGNFFIYGMGWMYRGTELIAAFARTQLTRLDDYLAQMAKNAAALTKGLEGTPALILPTVPPACGMNWYNYTVRFDMKALGHTKDAAAFRNKLVRALSAEGVQTGVWQGWPVPQMAAFQARNAYGRGCPWDCKHAGKVNYALDQYPVAQRHCDWHTGMTTPLRPPNGTDVARRTAQAFRKVMNNIDQVESMPD